MSYYKFKTTDIFYNRIEAHPQKQFFIFNSSVFLDNQSEVPGEFVDSTPNVDTGFVNLYELNVDRAKKTTGRTIGPSGPTGEVVIDNGLIYQFITKDGSLTSFRTMTTSSFNTDFEFGALLTSSLPLSASIVREFFTSSAGDIGAAARSASATHIGALKNTLNHYRYVSNYYSYSSSYGYGGPFDKGRDPVNLISVPSIFYGSSIQRGTVDLKFYITGTLIGQLKDENKNGELIQVGPAGSNQSGNVAGVVLYNEGFLVLTGSWDLYRSGDATSTALDYKYTGTAVTSSWLFYGVGANDGIPQEYAHGGISRASASYDLVFSGTNYVPTVTMMAHAPRGQLNSSNNPTYVDLTSAGALEFNTSSISYFENDEQTIKNTVKSPYIDPTGSYKPQTYISRVGIFDENKNLIGIAKLATPVKKTEERDITFKLKLDF